jgi:hypothetical protein
MLTSVQLFTIFILLAFSTILQAEPLNGQPGLYYGTVLGNINTTDPNPKTSVTVDLQQTEDLIVENTTEIYSGEFYDEDGKVSFTENNDDRTRLWIDGVLVLSSDNWRDRISTLNLQLTPGWHSFELRISNGRGASGPRTSPGFGYDPDGGTNWIHPSDPGDGSLFRTAPIIDAPPIAGYTRWFDASQLTAYDDGETVTNWPNLSGNGAGATVPVGNTAPIYTANATDNGRGALFFTADGSNGGARSSAALRFARDTNIRTVFSVFKGNSFLLTDSNTYHFHRPDDRTPTKPLWHGRYTSEAIKNGATYVNGLLVDGITTPMPIAENNGFNLISVVTTGPITADSFNKDRNNHAGEQYQAEIIMYDRVLTDTERQQVEAYLAQKWFGITSNQAPIISFVTADSPIIESPKHSTTLHCMATDADNDTLSYTWTKQSGAGDVIFSTATKDTTVSFTEAGSYVLSVTVSDGELSTSSNLSISVEAEKPPIPGFSRWFDASQLSNHHDGDAVSSWEDLSQNQANATVPEGNEAPVYTANATGNGLGALFFARNDGASNSAALQFEQNKNVRTVFSVFKGSSFLLTDHQQYHFHRPDDLTPTKALWHNAASPNIKNGETYVNGKVVNGITTALPNTENHAFNLISISTTGPVNAGSFNKDRNHHAGDQYQAEVIIYDHVLSVIERQKVEAYLSQKWFGEQFNFAPIIESISADASIIKLPENTTLRCEAIDTNNDDLSYVWSKKSGPGEVIFDHAAKDTTVTFLEYGTYTLEVSVSDGEYSTSQTVTVTAEPSHEWPSISSLADQTIEKNTSTQEMAFNIGDAETPVESLTLSATSTNPFLVPDNNINIYGKGELRTIQITPVSGLIGTTTITVTVNDGELETSEDFHLMVSTLEDVAGLWYGERDNNASNTPLSKSLITTSLIQTEDSIQSQTTEVFSGEIYDADGHISFSLKNYDFATLWIDDVLVLEHTSRYHHTESENLSFTPGWHKFELRLSNQQESNDSPQGLSFGYDPEGGSNWTHPEESGDMSLFRCKSFMDTHKYYIDPLAGDDSHDGQSENRAWKSLAKASTYNYKAGAKILLKRGHTYREKFTLRNLSGTQDEPIVISAYGSEEMAPVIDSAGYLAGIDVENCEHLEIEHLKLVSDAGIAIEDDADKTRYGIYVTNSNHVSIKDMKLQSIFPSSGVLGDAIYLWESGNLLVANSEFDRIARYGIRAKWCQEFSILNNRTDHTGGSGVQLGSCKQGLVRGNRIDYSGSKIDVRMKGRGSGSWVWDCEDVLYEKNEFLNSKGKADSCGVHIDWGCKNIVIQHCYSMNNEGGFIEILGSNYNCSYRYNISVNDGSRVKGVNGAAQDGKTLWLSGFSGLKNDAAGPFNTYIYNNTIYVSEGGRSTINISRTAEGIFMANNIFHIIGMNSGSTNPSESEVSNPSGVIFRNNVYIHDAVIPEDLIVQDDNPIFGDSDFITPDGLLAEDYKTQNMDLLKDKGIPVSKLPGDSVGLTLGLEVEEDIFGNPITGTPDIGAFEIGSEVTP